MRRLLAILLRLVLIGAFLPIFLGWLAVFPPPVLSSRLQTIVPALAQSILVFGLMAVVAWSSLHVWTRAKSLSFLLAGAGFLIVWSLAISSGF